MRKVTRNYLIALLMVLLALVEVVSGFVLWLALPQGRGGGGGGTFLWDRNSWINLHNWTGVALLVIVAIHIILHWSWIVRMSKSYFSWK